MKLPRRHHSRRYSQPHSEIDRLFAGIPAADRKAFSDWLISRHWEDFKQERMDQKIIMENEIRRLGLRLPNGTVKKDYEASFTLPVDRISKIRLEGAQELGLTFEVAPDGTCLISGRPLRAGDFTLSLRFSTVAGVPESTLAIPVAFNPNPRELWVPKPVPEGILFPKEDSEAAYVKVEAAPGEMPKKDIVAASRRGRSHAQEAKPRDDHFAICHCDRSDWYIIAVADGAGSAKYSREGSGIACKTVVDHCQSLLFDNPAFEEAIQAYVADRGDEAKRTELTRHVIDIVYKGALKAHEAIKRVVEANPGFNLRDMATTLMFAVCKKYDFGWFIASFWVGDGAMAIYDGKEGSVKLLGTPDEGEYSGQTRFLTMPEIFRDRDVVAKRMRMAIVPDFTALFLMTDGVSDPMFETDRNLSDPGKWKELYDALKTGFPDDDISGVDLSDDNEDSAAQLLRWLDFWSPGNHDDRTIAILY